MRAYPPSSIRYGGPAEIDGVGVRMLPEREWPVIDAWQDDWGVNGLLLAICGNSPVLIASIDTADLGEYRAEHRLCWCGRPAEVWRDLDPGDVENGPRPEIVGTCSEEHMAVYDEDETPWGFHRG